MENMKKYTRVLLKAAITTIILYFLFMKVGLEKIAEIILETNPLQILIAIIYVFILLILGTLNFVLLLRIIKKKIRFITLLKCYAISWSIGFFSPGKMGEFSIAYLLKRRGVPLGEASAVVVVEKLVSIASLVILSLLGLVIFESRFTLKIIAIVTIALIVMIALVLSNRSRHLIRRYILRRYAGLFTGFYGSISAIKKNHLIIISLLITSMKFIITAMAAKLVFQIYSISVPFISVLAIIAITSLASFIPISISGLGIRESIAVYLYKQIRVNSAYALTTQLLFTIVVYLAAALTLILRVIKQNKSKIEKDIK